MAKEDLHCRPTTGNLQGVTDFNLETIGHSLRHSYICVNNIT